MLSAALFLWSAASVAPPPGAAPQAPAGKSAPGKLSPSVAAEMQEAIIAMNKALGLESWPLRGIKPCVDRGGDGIDTKVVSAADTRTCAATALANNKFPGLGRDYVLTVLMASIGPVTVLAYGTGEAAGFGAYSCDPERKCRPVRLDPGNKWGKRLVERQQRACGDAQTIWFPADARACPAGSAPPTASASPEATQPPAAPPSKP